MVWNAGIDIVSHGGDDAHRATAVGIVTASGPIGFALGQGAGPLVAARFGWSAIFLVLTVVTLIGLAVFWPPSRGLGYSKGSPPTLGEFGSILRS